MLDITEKTQANEKGCLRYELVEQTEGENKGDFVVVERYWQSHVYGLLSPLHR